VLLVVALSGVPKDFSWGLLYVGGADVVAGLVVGRAVVAVVLVIFCAYKMYFSYSK